MLSERCVRGDRCIGGERCVVLKVTDALCYARDVLYWKQVMCWAEDRDVSPLHYVDIIYVNFYITKMTLYRN